MKVQVLFFGATASAAGRRRLDLELPDGSTAADALDTAKRQFPALSSHKLLLSIDQTYADGSEIVRDGAELAIFTAVSGG